MSWVIVGAVSFLSAALGAMGMGGGGILVLYLTAYAGVGQYAAQGVNLVFFVPVAVVALVLHHKSRLIRWKTALPCIVLGGIGVYFGVKLAMLIGPHTVSKLFGAFLLLIGVRELLAYPKKGVGRKNRKK